MVLRARGPDFRYAPGSCERPRPQLPSHRRSHRCKTCEDEPLFAERVAGLDIAKAEVEVTIRVPSDTSRGPPPAGDPDLRHHPPRAGVAGGLAALLGRHQGRDGGHRRLLETGVLPARIARVRLRAVQRRAGQGPARQAQNRPGRLDLARQDHRAGHGRLQLRAARADPPAAHPHPLPPSPHPGPHRREAAGRETARRRAPETVQRDLRHPRRLRPGHAGRARRRAARPQGAGPAGPRHHARQDPPAGRGAGLLVLHRRARRRAGHDAGHHRPLHHPDRGAHRHDRGADRAVPAPGRAARRRRRHRDRSAPRTSSPRSAPT